MKLPILCTPPPRGAELPPSDRGLLAKTLLIMRLTTILLLASVMNISAKGLAQKVSVSGHNVSLEKVFATIERQSHYSFLYKYNDLHATHLIDIDMKNVEVREVLDAILKEQNLAYTIEKYIIAIKAAPAPAVDPKAVVVETPAAIVSGVVKNDKNEPLAGVTVTVKGTQRSAVSNDKGEYKIEAEDGQVLVFTSVGYASKELTVGKDNTSDITLTVSQENLGEIVITALGIKRSEKSLTYATQQVTGDQLTSVKTDNLMNSLNGKVAGVTITPSASGVGGSTKVLLRGNRSANGNNQPLYVIDGIPISNGSNTNGQPGGTYGGNPDGGDGISNLNPEDIASITVLEGASAAALYGSQAQNGVILITTKKGKAGTTSINFSSSITAQTIAYKPKFQNSYGESTPTSPFSWDSTGTAPTAAHDNLNDFFRTGMNWTNAISLAGGNEKAQTYFSYANTDATGVEPTNKLLRNNFTLRETAKFLHDKLTVDGNVNYVSQKIYNSPNLGIYQNPLIGLYLFPRGKDISTYKNNYFNPNATGYARQNWPYSDDLEQQSPWWIVNQEPSLAVRNRILFTGSVKYEVAPWLSLQARGDVDHFEDTYESDEHSGTNAYFNSNAKGHMTYGTQTTEQKYGDFIANFTIPMHNAFKVNGLVGTSITDNLVTGSTVQGDLSTTDWFSINNIIASQPNQTSVTLNPTLPYSGASPGYASAYPVHSQIQSVFGNLDVSFNDWVYLTLTGRNDWSSNLAFTPNESFFYPSVGLSVILSQLLKLPAFINYGKVRGTYAQVGNTVPPYLTTVQNTANSSGQLVFNTAAAFRTLKPEKTNSIEFGTEWRMLNNRLNFTFTYYKTNTKNQFFPITPVAASLYSTGYVNAGNIQNAGIEFTVGYDVIKQKDFTWTTGFNGAMNRNKVIALDDKDNIKQFILTGSGNNAFESILQEGGQYGDVYGYSIQKDAQGRQEFTQDATTGQLKPVVSSTFTRLGNAAPRFQLGWRNDFTYKNWSLGVLVDGKFGGQVMSLTQAIMDQYGVSDVTGAARKKGFVAINGVNSTDATQTYSKIDPYTWYNAIGGRNGISGEYVYSATTVRLREADLGYLLPIPNNFFKSVKLSLIGRNLLYFTKKAPFDPELTMSTGNGLSGVDVFNQPATRNYGFSVTASF